jgi:hypothetical protein
MVEQFEQTAREDRQGSFLAQETLVAGRYQHSQVEGMARGSRSTLREPLLPHVATAALFDERFQAGRGD